jgi:hypothetical protein
LVLANVAALPELRKVYSSGHLHDYIEMNPELRDALMHRGDPSCLLPTALDNIPAYHALLEYAPLREKP